MADLRTQSVGYRALVGDKPVESDARFATTAKGVDFKFFNTIQGVKVCIDKALYKEGGYKPKSIDGGMDVIELTNGAKITLCQLTKYGSDREISILTRPDVPEEDTIGIFGQGVRLGLNAQNNKRETIVIGPTLDVDAVVDPEDWIDTSGGKLRVTATKAAEQ